MGVISITNLSSSISKRSQSCDGGGWISYPLSTNFSSPIPPLPPPPPSLSLRKLTQITYGKALPTRSELNLNNKLDREPKSYKIRNRIRNIMS